MVCEDSRKLATELSAETFVCLFSEKHFFHASVLFSFFWKGKLCWGKKPSWKLQTKDFFLLQPNVYSLSGSVKFSVSSRNCPFLFLSAGVVAALSEWRAVRWLFGSGSGCWCLQCVWKQNEERRRVGDGRTCLEKVEESSLGVGGNWGAGCVTTKSFSCSCCLNAFSFLIL